MGATRGRCPHPEVGPRLPRAIVHEAHGGQLQSHEETAKDDISCLWQEKDPGCAQPSRRAETMCREGPTRVRSHVGDLQRPLRRDDLEILAGPLLQEVTHSPENQAVLAASKSEGPGQGVAR